MKKPTMTARREGEWGPGTKPCRLAMRMTCGELLAALVVFCVFVGMPAWAKPAAPAAPAPALASAGFFEHPRASAYLLGFSSAAYVGEQGIWGLLLITEAQGQQFRQAFAETIGQSFDDPSMEGAQRKQLEDDFNRRVKEILTEDQKQMVSEVNRLVREWSEGGGSAANQGTFYDRLKEIATPEQLANFDALRGQKP